VYGPGQYPEKLIPKFISLLRRRSPCTIHGNGQHRRSFIFIDDVVEAFDVILHKGVTGQIYNIGTDFEITNLEVARSILRVLQLDNEEDKVSEVFLDKFSFVLFFCSGFCTWRIETSMIFATTFVLTNFMLSAGSLLFRLKKVFA